MPESLPHVFTMKPSGEDKTMKHVKNYLAIFLLTVAMSGCSSEFQRQTPLIIRNIVVSCVNIVNGGRVKFILSSAYPSVTPHGIYLDDLITGKQLYINAKDGWECYGEGKSGD